MRLTLRTLLAYMDDILEPADKEQLSKKIEASEFAGDLMHRTRDTMRRLRLGAPQVIGSGMGLDPNTVAEYLDNVLPPESVGDFERICLESDMHLAEAAACHHVLTMVLGEPADVDPIARQRMYSIPAEIESRRQLRVETAHAPFNMAARTSQIPSAPVSMSAPASPQASLTMEVPDYLRASTRSAWRRAVIGSMAVLLVGAAVVYYSGWRPAANRQPVSPTTRGQTPAAETSEIGAPTVGTAPVAATPPIPALPMREESPTASAVDAPATADEPDVFRSVADLPATQPETEAITTAPGAAGPLPQSAAPGDSAGSAMASAEPATPKAAAPTTPEQPAGVDATGEASDEVAIVEPAPGAGGVAPPTGSPTAPGETSQPPLPDSAPALASAAAPAADLLPPTPSAVPDSQAVAANDAVPEAADIAVPGPDGQLPPAVDDATAAAQDVPQGPIEVGTYLGGHSVLLHYDEPTGAWFRVGPRLAIVVGDRLAALPEYRPSIALLTGLNMDVSGGTQIFVRTPTSEPAEAAAALSAVPILEVAYGRIILTNPGDTECTIRLQLGANSGEAVLASKATLGVSVERPYTPGHDPRQSASPVIASLYAPKGGVHWHDAATTLEATGPSQWSIVDGTVSPLVAISSPPEWIEKEPIGQLSEKRLAAPKIEAELDVAQPVDIQLLELFRSERQREVKSLAAKCCIHIGEFTPFIDALRDSDQKANWSSHIDMLRTAMALSIESALGVKQALDEQRGQPAADDLYEMLCGYNEAQIGQTPAQVQTGAIARLIDWLEDDSLDYRVLAAHNLFEITGKRLMPDPAASRNERARNIKVWRARLESNDLLPANGK